jgi:hypothetical protein
MQYLKESDDHGFPDINSILVLSPVIRNTLPRLKIHFPPPFRIEYFTFYIKYATIN